MAPYDIFILCLYALPSAAFLLRCCWKGNTGRPPLLAGIGIVVIMTGSLAYVAYLMIQFHFY